jgi:hypothetical protein
MTLAADLMRYILHTHIVYISSQIKKGFSSSYGVRPLLLLGDYEEKKKME